jgi:TPR repeat protein
VARSKGKKMRLSHLFCGLALVALGLIPPAKADYATGMNALEKRDYATAFKEFQQAARLGDPRSQYQLGVLYVNGDGTTADFNAAATWFKMAAAKNHVKAKEALEFMIASGHVPENAPASQEVFIQVATTGSPETAEKEWKRQQRVFASDLAGLTLKVHAFETAGKDKMFRVLGGPVEVDKAKQICAKLKEAKSNCFIFKQ